MKDLYKRLGINKDSATLAKIIYSLENNASISFEDRFDARDVLLNKSKKLIYDNTHDTLTDISILRSWLNLNDGEFWRRGRYDDFTIHDRSSSAQEGIKTNDFVRGDAANEGPRTVKREEIFAILIALSVISIIAIFIFGKDEPRVKYQPIKKPVSSTYKPQSKHLEEAFPTAVIHVNTNTLNVRKGPSNDSHIIGRVEKYKTFRVEAGSLRKDWTKIYFDGQYGYVSSDFLAEGDGSQAKYKYCMQSVVHPPNGKILIQKSTGPHELKVRNMPDRDAIVKLKDLQNRTVLSFYLRKGQEVIIKNVPEGRFKFQFASGNNYSQACKRFMDGMSASSSDEYDNYMTNIGGMYESYVRAEFTLYKVRSGNFKPVGISLDEFLED